MLELAAPRELLEQIAIYSNGDARTAYNILELAVGRGARRQCSSRTPSKR